jgi:hypothetical protein
MLILTIKNRCISIDYRILPRNFLISLPVLWVKGKKAESQDIVFHKLFTICAIDNRGQVPSRFLRFAAPPHAAVTFRELFPLK